MPTKTLRIPTADGQADAFAAFPDLGERHPGVLIYTDAFGVRPVLRDMARELAGHGYYVLVPNIYYRHGTAPVTELPEHIGEEIRPAVIAKLMPLIEAHTTEQILRDADAYLRFLTAQPEVSAGPSAVIGYCIGAALAMRTAAAHPGQVAAVAGFHPGFLVTNAADSPHRLVPTLTAEVHLGLSENDMRQEAISELNQAMDAAGVGYTTEIYPGTIHGYTMSDTDAFNSSALQRHWDRLLPLLDRTLARRPLGEGLRGIWPLSHCKTCGSPEVRSLRATDHASAPTTSASTPTSSSGWWAVPSSAARWWAVPSSAARWSAARWWAVRWWAVRWWAVRWWAVRWSAARWSAVPWWAARWSAVPSW